MLSDELQSRGVTKDTQTTNNSSRLIAQITVVAERLAGMHVGDVYLDEGDVDARERVADRHARVRVSARVDDDGVDDAAASPLFDPRSQ